jgi:hypothetical protein
MTTQNSDIDILTSDEYLQFYMNVLILRGQEVAAAAVA